ncbi:1-deoxy-D-xylulose-5-phosphate reductoisomerase [Collinsella tanakaei]|uniref:1-deoxy-D-xylulose-5-phosphate reductoisomerase n=1 Tax=Collinsella tanakaei TaxID=626935 RepID=UPI0025A454CF|nr:1-deoxy-D-xylulose-5-phosphate reductoisomerase [Collinsella tanakaei]MDM8300500.1 1-deoxy-D-xylulose-5-phosphate reductoisomerase [Collinsella tanakaei]
MELADTALNQHAARLRVAILGCTGSIGTQALDVCRQHADRLQVVACSAHSRTEDLVRFAREFSLKRVAVTDPAHADDPILAELPDGCAFYTGPDAALSICLEDDVDCVLVAIVGAAGLAASAAVLSSGKRLALANKESLVVGGDLLMPLARKDQLIPVDSEHSAIFQCYLGEDPRRAHAIWLTCSGGPFYGYTRDQLSHVTVADALAHPTWNMGAKITIDSATLMNKGLERIEAMHLFAVDMDFIQVVIQRQSKIHSMVEYDDGSVIAHLGASDMRIPIQFAFSYPDRWQTPAPRVDFRTIGSLDFAEADADTFRCLALAEQAGRRGGTLPCVLNAANEVAVAAFLAGSCSFTDIDTVVAACMDAHDVQPVQTLEQLSDVDAWARAYARSVLSARR